MCAIGAALYFLIFGKLLLMRKKYSSSDKKFKGEIKLLFQASIIGGYTIFSEVAWHFATGFIPDELLASFFGNILWIGEAGLTPYIYLLINNSIRNAFFETLHLKKTSLIAPIVLHHKI
uniref:7TM GPCR serpentine receptor class x (Srx) domain-containing protein n=1 Tax=Acrobeloides nanus TaxID=290746 RepID=A0A914CJR8_9BILA